MVLIVPLVLLLPLNEFCIYMPTLNWIGKEKVAIHHFDVPFRVLEHKYGFRSSNPEDKSYTGSGNMIIHGDNLLALKALLPEFEGAIKCVYIDPPYNTGNEKWIYNDNVNDPRLQKWLGEVVGTEGEDFTRHDKWACMMYPRLRLIDKLMHRDAALIISIGYHELHSLIFLCREIFPTKQVVTITVQTSGGKPSGGFDYLQEYLVFVVNKDFDPFSLDFCGGVPRRPFEGLTLSTFDKTNRPNQVYPIFIDPSTESIVGVGKSLTELIDSGEYLGEKADFPYDYSVAPEGTVAIWPITNKGKECVWRQIPTRITKDWKKGYIKVIKNNAKNSPNEFSIQYLPEGLIKKINKGLLEVVGREEGKPTLILGANETEGSAIPTIWSEKEFYTVKGTNSLKNILPDAKKKFDYPKAPELVRAAIQAICGPEDIVLDSFAGSGTTAHAVLSLNKSDDGGRRFILVEMEEYADSITAERVKREMMGYPFKGTTEEVLYSRKLTIKGLSKSVEYLEEAQRIIEDNKDSFSSISKPKIENDSIVVVGKKVYEDSFEGYGGSFDYFELGQSLFDSEDNLNEEIDEEQIRKYIFYSETRRPLVRKRSSKFKYLLDTCESTGYYFYYEKNHLTELNHNTVSIIGEKADNYIVYADTCTLPKEILLSYNIEFKKIPRDIKRF